MRQYIQRFGYVDIEKLDDVVLAKYIFIFKDKQFVDKLFKKNRMVDVVRNYNVCLVLYNSYFDELNIDYQHIILNNICDLDLYLSGCEKIEVKKLSNDVCLQASNANMQQVLNHLEKYKDVYDKEVYARIIENIKY